MSYERVKYYFEAGLWSAPMVKTAVKTLFINCFSYSLRRRRVRSSSL
jgi:hypothetical protein